MTYREIGTIIKTRRTKLGWSQQELAKRLGVTWEMVSRYERGKSSALQRLSDIAAVLDVEISEFFGVTPSFMNFKDASSEYLTSRFIPVISAVPASISELTSVLSLTELGTRIYDDGTLLEKFGIRLGPDSKVRIATGTILPKGILICSLALGDLTEHSVVLVSRNNLVSLEQYQPGAQTTVLAKAVEWIVKF